MKSEWAFLIFMIILIGFACGCCEVNSEGISMKSINKTLSSNTTTIISFDRCMGLFEQRIYEGRIVEICFREREADIIRFEDDYVILTRQAEYFDWELGKWHRIELNDVGKSYVRPPPPP